MNKRPLVSLRLLTCQCTHTKEKPPPATTGTPHNKQQDINGYSIRDTKSRTGNRLVLILQVVEP